MVLTGIAAGLLGDELMLLLHGVQHLVFGYQSGSFVAGRHVVADHWWFSGG